MSVLLHLVLAVHLLSMATVAGGLLATRGAAPTTPILWGARTLLLTGLILVPLATSVDGSVDMAKITVKLLVALTAVSTLEISGARSRKDGTPGGRLVQLAGALVVVNVLVATLWH